MAPKRPPALAVATLPLLVGLTACESVLEPVGGDTGIYSRDPILPESGAPEGAESIETLLNMANFAEERLDYAAAVALYRRAHTAAPDWSEPLIRLGRAYMQTGALREAQGAFRDAVDRSPENADALRGLANTQIALGEPGGALPTLRKAVEIAPSVAAYNSLGVAYDLTGRHDQAQAAYGAGLDIDDRDNDLRINLALSLSLTGDLPGAVEIARRVGQSPSATTRHRQNYAMILAFAGDLETAREVARADLDDGQAARAINRFLVIGTIPDTAERAAAINAY